MQIALTQKACKDFELKKLLEFHDLYVLLAGIFKNFQDMCLGIYKLDSVCFLTGPR